MSPRAHLARIGLLMALAAVALGLLAWNTEVVYADGLRYIEQAQDLDRGSWKQALTRAQDHPVYPLAIMTIHRLHGGDRPEDWQAAAQIAAVLAGVLLVAPLYLLALELHGPRSAWLTCVLAFLAPLTTHVLADALSEGTFLCFWTGGCWCALRFLRAGSTRRLMAAIVLGGLAYLVRPEGLLLPASLAASLVSTLCLPSLRITGAAGWRAWAVLVIGPLLVIGPYVALKGGLATKPAVGRLLGLGPRSPATAVERERPLDPDQSQLESLGLAVRKATLAVLGAVPPPLFAIAMVGMIAAAKDSERRRGHFLILIILSAWFLAMVRLHATSGYCTPRHALIFALPLMGLAARGLNWVADEAARWLAARRPGLRREIARAITLGACLSLAIPLWGREWTTPMNHGFRGYRLAGDWIARNTPKDARILDLKGWGLFYGRREGYSFTNHQIALKDHDLGWVVANDALLIGPWPYCDVVRQAVGGRTPVRSFPEDRRPGVAQVHVFELSPDTARGGAAKSSTLRR